MQRLELREVQLVQSGEQRLRRELLLGQLRRLLLRRLERLRLPERLRRLVRLQRQERLRWQVRLRRLVPRLELGHLLVCNRPMN